MSLQQWRKASARRTRLPLCGHVLKEDDVKVKDFECPVCGAPQPNEGVALVRTISRIDFVPTEDLEWNGYELVATREACCKRDQMGHPWDLEKLLAKLTSSAGTIDLLKQTLRIRARVLGKHSHDPAYLHVLQSSTHGNTVQHGHIELPSYSVLFLTGHGARFINVTFSGGTVVCCGAEFHGTFRSCNFHGCTVYAVHGASVFFKICRCTTSTTSLIASGRGTALTAFGCRFDACMAGIVAEAGACVRCHVITINDSFTAVTVNDAGTRVALETCDVRCTKVTPVDVRVFQGELSMRTSSIATSINALRVDGASAAVELVDLQIGGARCAVSVTGGARVTLRRVEVLLPRGRPDPESLETGVWVGGHDENALGDSSACAAGALMMERCRVRGSVSGMRGLELLHGGRAALLLCAVETRGWGVVVGGGRSCVVAQCCSVRSGTTAAIVDVKGCSLRLKGCQLSGQEGACAVQKGGFMTAVDSHFSAEQPPENTAVVTVLDGATVRMHGGELRGGESGLIVSASTVRVSGASVRMHGGTASTAFVLLCEGSDTELTRCEFRLPEGHAPPAHGTSAVKLEEPARAVLEGCKFVSFLVGGTLRGGVQVRNCIFEGPYDTSVSPWQVALVLGGDDDTTGSAVVEGCSFDAADCCAHVQGVAAVFRGCSFAAGAVDAIRLREGANVTVAECEIRECRVGIMLEERATLLVKDTNCTGATVGIQVQAADCEVTAVGCTVQARKGCVQLVHLEGGCKADLINCDLSGAGVGLSAGYAAADVSLVNCQISTSSYGVNLRSAVRAHMRGTSISGCTTGVSVGGTRADLGLRCDVCGVEGERGWPQVFEALQRSGGRPVDGPLCAHTGAMALLSMTLTEIAKCDTGIYIGVNAFLDALGVSMTGCSKAVDEWYVAEPSQFEGCTAVATGNGTKVERWRVHGPEEGAATCEYGIPGVAVARM